MENRVVIILGTTASGKNRLGHKLSLEMGGEVVSMDSMKVFRGMDIGTAKPTPEERAEVPHHLIDILDPWENFSAKQFVELADAAVDDIHKRGKIAFIVGGTMLYFKAFYNGLFEGPSASPEIRAEIRQRAEEEGTAALFEELKQVDPASADRLHPNDIRRIERALEVYRQCGTPISELQRQWAAQGNRRQDWRWLHIGVRREKEGNSRRINARVKEMVAQGLVEEAKRIWKHPNGVSDQAAQAVGYYELFDHFEGKCPLRYATEQIKIHSRHLAKHQRTWMRKLKTVNWIDVEPTDKTPDVLKKAVTIINDWPPMPDQNA